jgi:hypothetical protein
VATLSVSFALVEMSEVVLFLFVSTAEMLITVPTGTFVI